MEKNKYGKNKIERITEWELSVRSAICSPLKRYLVTFTSSGEATRPNIYDLQLQKTIFAWTKDTPRRMDIVCQFDKKLAYDLHAYCPRFQIIYQSKDKTELDPTRLALFSRNDKYAVFIGGFARNLFVVEFETREMHFYNFDESFHDEVLFHRGIKPKLSISNEILLVRFYYEYLICLTKNLILWLIDLNAKSPNFRKVISYVDLALILENHHNSEEGKRTEHLKDWQKTLNIALENDKNIDEYPVNLTVDHKQDIITLHLCKTIFPTLQSPKRILCVNFKLLISPEATNAEISSFSNYYLSNESFCLYSAFRDVAYNEEIDIYSDWFSHLRILFCNSCENKENKTYSSKIFELTTFNSLRDMLFLHRCFCDDYYILTYPKTIARHSRFISSDTPFVEPYYWSTKQKEYLVYEFCDDHYIYSLINRNNRTFLYRKRHPEIVEVKFVALICCGIAEESFWSKFLTRGIYDPRLLVIIDRFAA